MRREGTGWVGTGWDGNGWEGTGQDRGGEGKGGEGRGEEERRGEKTLAFSSYAPPWPIKPKLAWNSCGVITFFQTK